MWQLAGLSQVPMLEWELSSFGGVCGLGIRNLGAAVGLLEHHLLIIQSLRPLDFSYRLVISLDDDLY